MSQSLPRQQFLSENNALVFLVNDKLTLTEKWRPSHERGLNQLDHPGRDLTDVNVPGPIPRPLMLLQPSG